MYSRWNNNSIRYITYRYVYKHIYISGKYQRKVTVQWTKPPNATKQRALALKRPDRAGLAVQQFPDESQSLKLKLEKNKWKVHTCS